MSRENVCPACRTEFPSPIGLENHIGSCQSRVVSRERMIIALKDQIDSLLGYIEKGDFMRASNMNASITSLLSELRK